MTSRGMAFIIVSLNLKVVLKAPSNIEKYTDTGLFFVIRINIEAKTNANIIEIN